MVVDNKGNIDTAVYCINNINAIKRRFPFIFSDSNDYCAGNYFFDGFVRIQK